MSMSRKEKGHPGKVKKNATVFVVDDDEQVRISIEQLVRTVGLTVLSCSSANEFLEGCNPSVPGCLVTDVRMPGMSGLELLQSMQENEITLPVIVMTGYAEVPMTVQAFHDGAFDFVQKPFSPQALLDTIQRAITADTRQRDRRSQCRIVVAQLSSLSPRETEVMRLLVDGRTTKEIAASLQISLTTVDFHRNNILDKMGVSNVVELTRIVAEHELLQRDAE